MLRPYTRPYRLVPVLEHALQARLEIVRVDPRPAGDRRSRGADGEAVFDDRLPAGERAQREFVTGGDAVGELEIELALSVREHLLPERVGGEESVPAGVPIGGEADVLRVI